MRRMAQFFTGIGVTVAVVGVGAYALGFRPNTLPPALLDLSIYKLVFIAATSLIAAGAVIGRLSRRRDADEPDNFQPELSAGDAPESWNANANANAKAAENARK